MNIGLDFHGVIDVGVISKELIKAFASNPKIKVFVLTGSSLLDGKLLEGLREVYNMEFWDGVYSIEDYLLSLNTSYEIGVDGNKLFPRSVWNSAKSVLAERLNLDFHIDDSEEYKPFFVNKGIPFILIESEEQDGV